MTLHHHLWGFSFYVSNLSINTLYGCETNIVFILKMESLPKNIIFGLKMMVKSGLEKIILKFLHAGTYFPLLHKIPKITNSVNNKNNHLPAWITFNHHF